MLLNSIPRIKQQNSYDNVLEKSNDIIATYGTFDELNSQQNIFRTTKDPQYNQAHGNNRN